MATGSNSGYSTGRNRFSPSAASKSTPVRPCRRARGSGVPPCDFEPQPYSAKYASRSAPMARIRGKSEYSRAATMTGATRSSQARRTAMTSVSAGIPYTRASRASGATMSAMRASRSAVVWCIVMILHIATPARSNDGKSAGARPDGGSPPMCSIWPPKRAKGATKNTPGELRPVSRPRNASLLPARATV